jgi:uncharacterized protein (TIRG00374 family)
VKRHALSVLRWTVALVGIVWVWSLLNWRSRALVILDPSVGPQWVQLSQPANETDAQFVCLDPKTGSQVIVPRDRVVNEPDRKNMTVNVDGVPHKLIGLHLNDNLSVVQEFLVDEPTGNAQWIAPEHVDIGPRGYQLSVPHPRIQIGIAVMVQKADPKFLWVAILIFPVTILITTIRWHELLRVLDVHLTPMRTLTLNMVGLFWNTCIPAGTTGGDVAKAYYVALQTHHRTRAVMSVLVDRVLGLLALIILGGTMAALQWHSPECRWVAIVCGAILAAVALSLLVYYNPSLHKAFFIDAIARRMPMQTTVQTAMESLDLYGRRPGTIFLALIGSIPVHMVVVSSAMFCGMAFHLPIPNTYYWTVVPVVVLAGSIPISPQGAGVMETFAFILLHPLGVTPTQAVALTMSIRLVQILWNLTGGIFVLKGGFHVPTQTEQEKAEQEDADIPHESAATETVKQ